MGPIRVASIQLPGVGGTVAERADLARAAIAETNRAADGGASADLYVLPEACFPGYTHVRASGEGAARAFAESVDRRVVVGFIEGAASCAGIWEPGGSWIVYQKRFPTPAESRVWRAGRESVVAQTGIGRVGMLICADVLQIDAWEDLRGRVDVVAVCAAWPEYRGRWAPPGLAWLYAESNGYRDDLLGRAARSLGVPVVFANACGPGFSGGSAVWSAAGKIVAEPHEIAVVEASCEGSAEAPPEVALRHPARWAAFTHAYRWAAEAREQIGGDGR